jgi:hypothetical protein
VTGTVVEDLGDYYLQTEEGLRLLLIPTSKRPESGKRKQIEGYFSVMSQEDSRYMPALVTGLGERSRYFANCIAGVELSPFSEMIATLGGWCVPDQSFPEELRDSIKDWRELYSVYVNLILKSVKNQNIKGLGASGLFRLSQARLQAFSQYSSLFHEWRNRYLKSRQLFQEWVKNRDGSFSPALKLKKNELLLYLFDQKNNAPLFAFPVGLGLNPDMEDKKQEGDFRTPESSWHRGWGDTPLFISKVMKGTVHHGMTGAVLGIGSLDPKDAFWVSGGGNMAIHGTPVTHSVGMLSSHGCIRLFEADIRLLAGFVTSGVPLLIQ